MKNEKSSKKPAAEREFHVTRSDKDKQYYWNAKSPKNGKTTFSGEGHPSLTNATRAIVQEMKAVGSTLPIVIHVKDGKKEETIRKPAPVRIPKITPQLVDKAIDRAFIQATESHLNDTPPATTVPGLTTKASVKEKPAPGKVEMPSTLIPALNPLTQPNSAVQTLSKFIRKGK